MEDPAISSLVPDGIRKDGILRVATDPTYPPLEFLDEQGQVQGADIDLVVGIATVLGLEPQFEEEAFTAIPVAVRTGRYELGVAGLTIRQDQRQLNNAVTYLRAGSQLVRSAAAPELGRDTLCGAVVAALEGSVQIEELVAKSRDCRSAGQKSVEVVPFPDQESATDAVLTGAAQGLLADSPVTQDIVDRYPGELEPASRVYAMKLLGMLTAAEYTSLTRAIQQALQQMIDTGYYGRILADWNVQQAAVGRARIKWADFVKRGTSGG